MNNDRIGLHVRKLEATAIIFKILLVGIWAMKRITGKLVLDCSSSLMAFETKLRFFPLLTRRFDFFQHVFLFFSIPFYFNSLLWCQKQRFLKVFLFALDTCLMLASEYFFFPLLFVYTWEEEQKCFFLIIWTHDQWIMPSTLKHFLVKRKFVLWSVAKNQTLLRINHTLVRLFRSPLCKLLS